MDLSAPLLLRPIVVPKPWGGHRLAALGRHDDHETRVGESWDVADLPQDATPVADPVSRVIDGQLAGLSLHDLVRDAPEALLGIARRSTEGRFPLLVKLLDARETLSVQVHPPASLEPTRSKTESWVILDAEPGSELLLGLRDGVTRAEVADTIGTKAFLDLCAMVPATAGDVVHLPAGTVHALGAGVLVAEVQTPSDVTHRLWDWPDVRDAGRELHVEAGRRAIEAGWEHNFGLVPAPLSDGALVDTDAYRLDRITLDSGQALPTAEHPSVRAMIVLSGSLEWSTPAGLQSVTSTAVALLPGACETEPIATTAGTTVLLATPS